jgi:hypothetical protein
MGDGAGTAIASSPGLLAQHRIIGICTVIPLYYSNLPHTYNLPTPLHHHLPRPPLISFAHSSAARAQPAQTQSCPPKPRPRRSSTATPLVSGSLCAWPTHRDDNADHSGDSCDTAVFSKSYCPYCKSAKTLLSEKGAKAYIIELDQVGTSSKQGNKTHPPWHRCLTTIYRRRCRHPGRPRGDDQAALRPQHLHRAEAHRW